MKTIKSLMYSSLARILALTLAAVCLSSRTAHAHPYASGIGGTNAPGNSVGVASFILNESADDVTVIYDPGLPSSWTNDLGALTSSSGNGLQQFLFPATNTSYQIIVRKVGNGIPSLISSDTFSNAGWGTPRGIAINKNPASGAAFGRLYAGNAGANPPHYKGIYAFNADLSDALGKGTNASGSAAFAGSGTSGPYRMRVNDDGTLLVTDASTAAAAFYQFTADLSSSNLVLSIIGQNAAVAAGIHSDPFGTPKMMGSLAQGNLVLYTADPDLPASGDTNCIKGPYTTPGSFNCIFRYNIGAGPIPAGGWNKRPDFAYTLGLDGLALFLNTEVDVGTNGIIYGSFGRANASDPNIQILRPILTTNGITGDLVNKTNQDRMSSITNYLYVGGVNPPDHVPPAGGTAGDPWTGGNGSGSTGGGSYSGVRISPDYVYFASGDIGNGATIATLTNGVPDESSIFGIAPQNINPFNITGLNTANARGMDWDAADNLWITSSGGTGLGYGLLRGYSLGLTTTCITSNDWTGTNGSFQLVIPPLHASLQVVNRDGTQNYTNNVSNGGVAQPAVFRITLATNDTTALGPTFVGYARNGTGPDNGGIVGVVNVTNGGTNYTTAPTVTFVPGGGGGLPAYGAQGVANISGGKVVSITVTQPGFGYTATPTISFSGGGGGSNATATVIRGVDVAEYTINTNDTPNGVQIFPNGVLFPAGVNPASPANWSVDVKFTPTQYPVSGPTYPMNVRLLGGTNYATAAPFSGALNLINTGPQFLRVANPAPASQNGMSRGIPHDSARFVITRWGDTNGPGNDAINTIVPRPLVIPTVNYIAPSGNSNLMAKPGTDFTALAQNYTGTIPTDGSPGITINPGQITVTAMIGNPVLHANVNQAQSNLTVIINLTNVCNTGSTPGCDTNNLVDANGKTYNVSLAAVTLSEFDNSLGGETVLWSNPLTNSFDSTNWTVVYATALQDLSPTLPAVVFSNYNNSANVNGGQFLAVFGKPVSGEVSDSGVNVPQSSAMAANNWPTALKVTVNKNPGSAGESGVNLYPQLPGAPWNGGSNMLTFNGNYALRFDMFLSLYDFGINFPSIGTPAREFALFGINHRGTNANWRLDVNPRLDGTGARPINADGQWCAIDAASGSITPADYDMFISPGLAAFATNGTPIAQPVPYTTANFTLAPFTNAYQAGIGNYTGVTNFFGNAGVAADQVSANNNAFGGAVQNGIIKTPPFIGINANGGAPDNAWVDVSLELKRQTNLTLKVAQQAIFSSSITNGAANNPSGSVLAPLSGTPMLGYLDPNANVSDDSAFVYYSNMRVVELSPYIAWTNQPPSGIIVTQGTTAVIPAGAQYGTPPLTNIWYRGQTNASAAQGNTGPLGNRDVFTMTAPMGVTNVFTNYTVAANGITNGFGFTNLSVANIQGGTNYMCSWSDSAGGITSYVAVVEVILGPGVKTVTAGTTNTLAVTPSGNHPPTAFQWKRGGTNLVASTHFGGVTAATLGITNITPDDAGLYSNVVTSADGAVIAVGQLNVNVGPNSAAVVPSATNRPWGSAVTFAASVTNTSFPGGVPTGPLTYRWKRGGVNLTDGGDIAGSSSSALTITNLSQSAYGGTGPLNQYTFGVTNAAGGVVSSAGTLSVDLLPHTVTGISVTPSNVVMSFVSSNSFDTTNAFTLQSAGIVDGPYTNAPGTIITTGGGFQVTAPYTGAATLFYRLVHSN